MNKQTLQMARLFLMIFSSCLLAACAIGESPDRSNAKPLLSSAPDFVGVNFKPGRPRENDALMDAIEEPKRFFLDALDRDRRAISKFPGMKFRAVGYTDNMECNGDACITLSVRRAQYVQAWMVENGVPTFVFKTPKGYGSAMPIEDNATEEGRLTNRRAGISFVD